MTGPNGGVACYPVVPRQLCNESDLLSLLFNDFHQTIVPGCPRRTAFDGQRRNRLLMDGLTEALMTYSGLWCQGYIRIESRNISRFYPFSPKAILIFKANLINRLPDVDGDGFK